MDTYAIPKNAPHIEEAHAMINHGIWVEGQVHLANALGQAVVNNAAVPHLNEQNRGLYLYDEISSGNVEAVRHAGLSRERPRPRPALTRRPLPTGPVPQAPVEPSRPAAFARRARNSESWA